jgi:hypothetical protein
MSNKASTIIGLLCLLVLASIIFIKHIGKEKIKDDILKNGEYSICRVKKFDDPINSSQKKYHYYFYFNGKKYFNSEDIREPFLGENAIGNFYVIKFLKEDPSKSIVFLKHEIVDREKIKEAGFTIIIEKKSFHNYKTDSYYFKNVEKIW